MTGSISKLFFLAILLFSYQTSAAENARQQLQTSMIMKTKAPVAFIEIIKAYPHDAEAFTQGLLFEDGFYYESTGINGRSGIFKKDIRNGKILRERKIDSEYFGEGLAFLKGKLYQLTWQSETMLVYDASSFQEIKKIKYTGEGWGLTTNGRHLLMSNGTSTISIRDVKSFKVIREIQVRDGDTPVDRINELEFIKGEIWANIYLEDIIVRISPESGKVKGWIDLSSLRSYLPQNARVDVINGIAYDKKNDRIFVTGKLWPKIFEIKVKENKLKKH